MAKPITRRRSIIAKQLAPRRERQIVLILCAVAALRVFVLSAAFPFFNNVDEQYHVDLVMKYARADWPRALGHFARESTHYLGMYGTLEYFMGPRQFENGRVPSPTWALPSLQREAMLRDTTASWLAQPNHESGEPPLYYALAASWLNLGRLVGIAGGWLLYWVRFLNVFIGAALVWVGFSAAKIAFPDRQLIRLGVPLLLAIWPQSVLYSIQGDVLSPLCFGIAFVGFIKFLKADTPRISLAVWMGLSLAATCLSKTANLPLLGVGLLAVILKTRQVASIGKLRSALPAFGALALSAGLPLILWFAWNVHMFGDLTATRAKIEFLGWTHKPIAEWLPHPILTLSGWKQLWPELIASFWRGEFVWHGQRIAWTTTDAFYWLSSTAAIMVTIIILVSHRQKLAGLQRQTLWLALASVMFLLAFIVLLSISYDFGNCLYPSRERPFFTSGRLICAAAVPFFLFYSHAIDWALSRIRLHWLRLTLFGVIVFIAAVPQTLLNRPVFSSQFNFFHLRGSSPGLASSARQFK